MLRKQLYASPVLRGLVLDRWVANASVESALVYALPSHIYNSPAFRHIMFLLVNYVIPFYSVIRGVGALVPHLTTLSFLLRADVGLNFMMGFFDFYSRRAAQLMVNSLFYVAARVPLHDHVVSITRPINSRLQPVMFALGRGMYLLHRFVFAYLIPNNIFFQYLQNQFVLLQYTFGQIWSQSYGVVSYAFTNLRSSGAQLVSVMSMFLVKPLPAPNVMQVTSNVVHGGMTLVKAIAVSPDASNRSLGLKSAGGDGPVLVMRERKSGRRMADDTREMQKSIDRDSSQAQSPIRLAGDLISPVGSPESLPTLLDEFDLLPAEESAEATATQL
ncbi:unnamed protein product [Symbiodinium microadriaticum]|nr:unnamed protein product [Symbiodinium microadriaticum]